MSWIAAVLLLLVTCPRDGHLQGLVPETCPVVRTELTVEPEADVTIGALLSAHAPGPGVFGCGRPRGEGVEAFEAMRWAIDLLNQDSGVVNGDRVVESFIPGVKLGLKVLDTCGHQGAALQHLTELYPVLSSGSAMCGPDPDNSSILLGVLDLAGVTTEARVAEAVFDYVIPAIPLADSTALSPEHVAKLLTEAAHDMEWTRVAVLHADDEYSIHITKQLGQLASAAGGSPCIAAVHSLAGRNYRQVVTQLTGRLPDDTGVLVIGRGEAFRHVLDVLAEIPDTAARFQWLFSWVPPPSALLGLGKVLETKRIMCLGPHPGRLAPLEKRWALLQDPGLAYRPGDAWFRELVTDRKNCRVHGVTTNASLPPCANLVLQESPVHVLARTGRAVPVVHAVFTFGHALHRAWRDRCHDTPGVCPALRRMTRREFVADYLDSLEFEHSALQRSPPGLSGHKSPGGGGGTVEGMKVALTLLTYDPSLGVGFQPVVAYDPSAAEVLDSTFRYRPSSCPAAGCTGCIRVRQSRLDDMEEPVATEGLVTIGRPEDLVIPLVLPLHEAGTTPLRCGSSVDPIAVQDLEAALWTLDRINSDSELLPGVRLGAVVIDTCSSPLKAAQRLSGYLSSAAEGATIAVTSALAAITTSSKGTAAAVSEMLSPLNITTVASGDIFRQRRKRPPTELLLQVAPPAEVRAEAVMEVLKYLGWTYVSVVYSDSDYEIFRQVALQGGVCIALEQSVSSLNKEDLDRTISLLLDSRERGARVVVLWTAERTTRALQMALRRAVDSGKMRRGDLVLLSAAAGGVNAGSEPEFAPSVNFQSRTRDVQDFVEYFQRASSSAFQRNPWLRELVQQQCADCTEAPSLDDPINYVPSPSTGDTIQAVLAVASGLVRLETELCPADRGLCPQLLREPQLRHLLHQSVRRSKSGRTEDKEEQFAFTAGGYGNTPVDIFNLRRGIGGSWSYQKAGSYQEKLTNLVTMVTYGASGDEVPLDRVLSECVGNCGHCSRKTTDFLVMESRDQLYIAAALGVHEPAANPLDCGLLLPSRGIQPLEALLWTIGQINASPRLLPGLQLGAVVMDTCNSRERAARDVSNLFGGTLAPVAGDLSSRLPTADQIVGVVAGQSADVVQPIADVTTPLEVTTIATEASGGALADPGHYPYLLRLAVPHSVLAGAVVTLLKHFRWTYVSAVHSTAPWNQGDVFTAFRDEARRRGVHLATDETIPDNSATWNRMDDVVLRLKKKQQEGARVVVVLLSSDQTDQLLTAVERAQRQNLVTKGDFVWVSVNNVEAFHLHPDQSLGALTLRVGAGLVPDFKRYFEGLTLRNHSANPWFKEYWETAFHCRGAACYAEDHSSLRQVAFMQHPLVPRTVNAVLALAFGLDALRKSLCPSNTEGLCPELKDRPDLRRLLFNYTRAANFTRPDASTVRFTAENYEEPHLDVFSFRQVGSNAHAFVAVGRYSEPDGLTINASRVKGYDGDGSEFNMYDLASQCNSSATCPEIKQTGILQMLPESPRFSIAVVMPVHRQGPSFFTCGPLTDTAVFQNLAAVTFAVSHVNANATLLPDSRLAALVLDSCGRHQRAEEMVYSYFANAGRVDSEVASVPAESVVGAVSLGGDDAFAAVEPILKAAAVSHLRAPSTSSGKRGPAQRSPSHELQVLLDVLQQFGWQYVYLVHGNTDYGREAHYRFSKKSKSSHVCVAGTVVVEPSSTVAEAARQLRDSLAPRLARVVVLLVDDPRLAEVVVAAAAEEFLLDRFVWIGTEGWPDAPLPPADVLKVKMESRDIPEFRKYLSRLTLGRHEPIPDPWFEEYWQHQFRCQLPHSPHAQRHYPDVCTGRERLEPDAVHQDRYVYQTVRTVEGIARGLHAFLTSSCEMSPEDVDTVDNCGRQARDLLDREIHVALGDPVVECEECGDIKPTPPYEVVQLQNTSDGQPAYIQVGTWKDGRLSLREGDVPFSGGRPPVSVCTGDCHHCRPKTNALVDDTPSQHIYANFRTVWGIVVTSLSVLGMVLVAICTLYFLMAFPVTVGSTVLGYMILAGLFGLYAVNFAFIVVPTEGTCGVRRFVLGLAYAVIFSGMLVKVMNTWRLMGYHGNRMLADGTRLSSPAGLLVIAVGLVVIQVVLSAAWLILMPPRTGVHGRVWRCAPPSTFEEGLVISLVYVMLLLAVTALFALLTWKSTDNNREPRWILACCVFVGLVWLAWTVLSTQLPPAHRDTAIVGANLVSATVVMLCLYLRKVYLYSKLTRQARDRELKARLQPAKYPHNLYGFMAGPLAALSPVLYGSQASLNGKKIFGGPPSRLELIACPPEDSRSDSSGSVQVQAADLYPLDMYDGGSQFQPMASLYGSNHTLVLDDTVTFTR